MQRLDAVEFGWNIELGIFLQPLLWGRVQSLDGGAHGAMQPLGVLGLFNQVVGERRPLIGKHMVINKFRSVEVVAEGEVMVYHDQ